MTDAIVRILLAGAGAALFLFGFAWMILRAVFPRGGSGFLAGLLLGWVAGRQRPAPVVIRGAPSPVIQIEPRRRFRWLWIVLGGLALYAIARH
jgi:drug/metabolite transporter (DMT)-like permease